MESESLICSVCYEGFDEASHLPRILPRCGHTLCSLCVLNMLKDSEPRCPLDKISFADHLANIETFPINYTVKQLLEGRKEKGFCQKHKRDYILVCFTDQKKICSDCIWMDGHTSHKMKSLDSIKSDALRPKKQLENLVEELDQCEKKVKDVLEKEKEIRLAHIKSTFESIRNILFNKELELSLEVSCFFDKERKRAEYLMSNLKDQLYQRVCYVANICQNEDSLYTETLFEDTNFFIKEFGPKMRLSKIKKEIEDIESEFQEFEENNRSFVQPLQNIVKWCSQLKLPINSSDSVKNLVDIFAEPGCQTFTGDTPEKSMVSLRTPLSFKLERNKDCLSILVDKSQPPGGVFDSENLDEIKEVRIELKSQVTEKLDLQMLYYIFNQFKESPVVRLKINPDTLSEELYRILVSTLSKLNEAEITLENYRQLTRENRVTLLVENLLNETKEISLVLNNSWLDIKGLKNGRSLEAANLVSFTLNLGDQDIVDQSVSNLLVPMPNLKKVKFDLRKTKITDRTVDSFVKNTLCVAENLEDLSLTMFRTEVTDKSLSSFRIKSKKLKFFFLDVGMTRITSQGVKNITEALANSCENMESFTLSLGDTRVHDDAMCEMLTRLYMPNIKSFFLSVWSTNVSDKMVESFMETSLGWMNGLKNLTLWLNETKVTDQSLKKLFSMIDGLTQLRLNLKVTEVSDDSIGCLKNLLLNIKTLERLEVELSNTKVSAQLQAEIQEIINNISRTRKAEPSQL